MSVREIFFQYIFSCCMEAAGTLLFLTREVCLGMFDSPGDVWLLFSNQKIQHRLSRSQISNIAFLLNSCHVNFFLFIFRSAITVVMSNLLYKISNASNMTDGPRASSLGDHMARKYDNRDQLSGGKTTWTNT